MMPAKDGGSMERHQCLRGLKVAYKSMEHACSKGCWCSNMLAVKEPHSNVVVAGNERKRAFYYNSHREDGCWRKEWDQKGFMGLEIGVKCKVGSDLGERVIYECNIRVLRRNILGRKIREKHEL